MKPSYEELEQKVATLETLVAKKDEVFRDIKMLCYEVEFAKIFDLATKAIYLTGREV